MMDPRPTRWLLKLLAFLALAIACGVAIVWWLNRPPLAGDRAHDFGIVRFESPPKQVEHTFALTNRTNETLEVESVRTTCGCTVASTTATTVEPGESFGITVKLSFSQSGHRRKPLYVMLKDRDPVTLWIEGTGRQTRQLASLRDEVELRVGAPAYVSIYYLRFEDDPSPPPSPVIKAPESVTATIQNWKLGVRGRFAEGKPEQWGGQIEFDYDGTPLPDDAVVDVAIGGHQLAVRLNVVNGERSMTDERPAEQAVDRSP